MVEVPPAEATGMERRDHRGGRGRDAATDCFHPADRPVVEFMKRSIQTLEPARLATRILTGGGRCAGSSSAPRC